MDVLSLKPSLSIEDKIRIYTLAEEIISANN
jgi:hypothetical protein